MEKIDVVVVGGGIVGLWTAYEILKNYPHLSLALYEKELHLGEHSTGRNSEVLHSGIYYPYQSLKHLTCLEGNRLWREFIQKYNLNFLDSGKYVVALSDQSLQFDQLFEKARNNNVPGVRKATAEEVKSLKSEVACDQAFFCPTSGVLGVSDALKALSQLIHDLGGFIVKGEKFQIEQFDASGFIFNAGSDKMRAGILINAAGHHAVELRSQLGLSGYQNRLVKGNYLSLKRKLKLHNLIYPLPPAHGLGLGVHLTLDVSGAQKFGPNTEEASTVNYAMSEAVIEQMFPAISQLFPNVQMQSLALAYAGIRSKILDQKGQLQTDFIIGTPKKHNVANYYEYLGIESPGITASPSLAKLMVSSMFS